nr:methylated-DNA--protein-cysteine methyltransferase [Onthophagus taurus]
MKPNITIHILPQNEARNLEITYKFITTKSLGNILIGYYDEKICHVSFQDSSTQNLEPIQQDFINCHLLEDTKNDFKEEIFSEMSQDDEIENIKIELLDPIDIVLTGTDFQIKTWEALTKIESGTTVSYEEVAEMMGRDKKSVRAVAGAISKNKIAYLVPCHRVINKNGDLSKYKWGAERKKFILDFEKRLMD